MAYQYKREPLSDDEVNRLTNACETFEEKLVVWTLPDTGLRVSELANLNKTNIQWQERQIWFMVKTALMAKRPKEGLYLGPRE